MRILVCAILLVVGVLILPAFSQPSIAASIRQASRPPHGVSEFQTEQPLPSPTVIQTQSQEQSRSYAIGWGTLALINGGIAQGKNRSGGNWFFLSLLFGPLATFVLVVFFPKLDSTDDSGYQQI
jgi:hypothetical protein